MIEAITLDFFDTLVFHRDGRGRGRMLMDYLAAQGLECDPWEHQVLYDVFDRHDVDYSPELSPARKETYVRELARRVFERLNVRAARVHAELHADAIWELLGPASFDVFPDVPGLLDSLKSSGYPLGIVSNWQRGLRHFCVELGVADAFDHVLSSAEVGSAKPDARIFEEACRRLGTPPGNVLHVGDSFTDDYEGGRRAGLHVLLLRRRDGTDQTPARTITSLGELQALLPAMRTT